jgi:hypothetical protein
MRAVVTIVVSKAEMKRQNHNPAIIVCNLAGLILGTLGDAATGLSADFAAMLSPNRYSQVSRKQGWFVVAAEYAKCRSTIRKMVIHIFPAVGTLIRSVDKTL